MIHLEGVVEDPSLCLSEETPGGINEIKSTSQSLPKGNVQKLDNVLHPCLKQTLLQCLRKNSLLFHVSSEGGSWFTRYLEFLLPRSGAPRQKLGHQSRRRITEIPAPAPGPIPSGVSEPSPPPSSSPKPFFPVYSSPPPVVDESSSTNSSSGGNVNVDKKSNNRVTIIVAVVVTAAVTFFLAALLFFCCRRLRNGGDRWNDERPLLSVSMSNYTVGMYYIFLIHVLLSYTSFKCYLLLTKILII